MLSGSELAVADVSNQEGEEDVKARQAERRKRKRARARSAKSSSRLA